MCWKERPPTWIKKKWIRCQITTPREKKTIKILQSSKVAEFWSVCARLEHRVRRTVWLNWAFRSVRQVPIYTWHRNFSGKKGMVISLLSACLILGSWKVCGTHCLYNAELVGRKCPPILSRTTQLQYTVEVQSIVNFQTIIAFQIMGHVHMYNDNVCVTPTLLQQFFLSVGTPSLQWHGVMSASHTEYVNTVADRTFFVHHLMTWISAVHSTIKYILFVTA